MLGFRIIQYIAVLLSLITSAYAQQVEIEVQSISNQPASQYGKTWQNVQVSVRVHVDVELSSLHDDQALILKFIDSRGSVRSVEAKPWIQAGSTQTIWQLHTALPLGRNELHLEYHLGPAIYESHKTFELGERFGTRLFGSPIQLSYLSEPSASSVIFLAASLLDLGEPKQVRLHIIDEQGFDVDVFELKPMSSAIDFLSRDEVYADAQNWFVEITDKEQIQDKTFYLSYEVGSETHLDDNLGYNYRLDSHD